VTHRLISDGGSHDQPVGRTGHQGVRLFEAATDDGDASTAEPVRRATTGAPVFEDALVWMDCEVRQSIDLGTHTLFVGEVVDAGINDDDARAAAKSDTAKYGGVKRR
jgi:flavin reductase (DIM6/NTAB) family NADH-FMN oxidoreductase RutF